MKNVEIQEPQETPQFLNGLRDGKNADKPLSAFDMSPYVKEYILGYIAGQSYKQQTLVEGARTAGELGCRYSIPPDELVERLELDDELGRELRQSWRTERENERDAPENQS